MLVLSGFDDGDLVVAVMKAGAAGYLLKDTAPAAVLQGIRDIHAGRPVLAPTVEAQLLRHLRQADSPAPSDRLSQRELEVLRLMARGLSNADIANALTVSEGTVRSHISRILAMLNLANRAQAVIYAVRQRLVDPQ